jgi:hypothetical protein
MSVTMKTLALKIETIRVLQSSELDGVYGGVGKLSSVFQGGTQNETHVSSALNPTATAVSSAKPGHHHHQAAQPTSSAVSSAHKLSSVLR